jgi:hypothetical protein
VGQFSPRTVRYYKNMRLLTQLAALVFWLFLWTAIPAALLYPVAVWMGKHTRISGYAPTQSYGAAIGLLFLPTGFLIDFMFRRFVRDRHANKPPDVTKNPS